jgi:hypothetical protein
MGYQVPVGNRHGRLTPAPPTLQRPSLARLQDAFAAAGIAGSADSPALFVEAITGHLTNPLLATWVWYLAGPYAIVTTEFAHPEGGRYMATNQRQSKVGMDTGAGVAVGISLGLIFGLLMNNLGLGLGIGAAFGVVLGELMHLQNGRKSGKP